MATEGPLRILVLSPIEPYPPNGGWALVVYNDLLNLQNRGHELHLLANTSNATADPGPMERVCHTQYFYKYKPPRWRQVIANAGDRLPFSVARYVNREITEAARRIIALHGIDVVLCEDVAMGTYGPALNDEFQTPFFIRGHNVDTQILQRFLAEQRNPVLRVLGRWQERKLRSYEGSILGQADGFSMITESDAAEVRRLFPNLKPAVVGAGTDLSYFQNPGEPRQPSVIIHVGSLTAFTKLEALLWFCREVLPLIRKQRPDATLELVGSAPAEAFAAFERVSALGRVPDERPYLWHGRVFIAPQFVGSGVRLKILNAMATGNAVVCTPIACEGIPLRDGEHALIRETPSQFADAVLSVLGDDALADRLGRNGRRLVEAKYGWDVIVAELERLLRQAIAKARRAGS